MFSKIQCCITDIFDLMYVANVHSECFRGYHHKKKPNPSSLYLNLNDTFSQKGFQNFNDCEVLRKCIQFTMERQYISRLYEGRKTQNENDINGEDTFELHTMQLELEAVEKQIRDLLEKQAELRVWRSALLMQ